MSYLTPWQLYTEWDLMQRVSPSVCVWNIWVIWTHCLGGAAGSISTLTSDTTRRYKGGVGWGLEGRRGGKESRVCVGFICRNHMMESILQWV